MIEYFCKFSWVTSLRMWLIRFSLSPQSGLTEKKGCVGNHKETFGQLFSSSRRQGQEFQDLSFGFLWSPTVVTARRGLVHQASWRRRMALNLSKNGVALMAAYKEVVDSKSDTNWWGGSFDCGMLTSNCQCVVYSHVSNILGHYLPMRGTVMISVWRKREVRSALLGYYPLSIVQVIYY